MRLPLPRSTSITMMWPGGPSSCVEAEFAGTGGTCRDEGTSKEDEDDIEDDMEEEAEPVRLRV